MVSNLSLTASSLQSAMEGIYGGRRQEILVTTPSYESLNSSKANIRYNTETKQSSWEMPSAYKEALAQNQPPPRPAPP